MNAVSARSFSFMSVPRLPQRIDPPKIPNSMRKGAEQQEPPKSNFFFILMMTFLVIWTFRVFRSDDNEPIVADKGDSVVDVGPAPELTEDVLKTLPKDFLEAAESSQTLIKPSFVTLGSLDPESSYRMLVTLSNRGASITRVELNESAYIDNSDSSGYLGQIIVDETLANDESRLGLPGVCAQAVGAGTPIDLAGIKSGDRIVSFTDSKGTTTQIKEMIDLREALLKTKPGDKVRLGVYKAEVLQADTSYLATALTAAKTYMNKASKPFEDIGSSETQTIEEDHNSADVATEIDDEVVADSNDDPVLAATDAAEKDGVKEDSLIDQDQRGFVEGLGEPTQVEVQLTRAPLSVLRPSGLVRDYEDYLDIVGLQGGYVDFGENENNYLRNYDKKAPHVRKVNSEPASFLTTLGSIDGEKIASWAPGESSNRRELNADAARSPLLDAELAGVNLRNGFWEYVADESSDSVAVFRKILLERRLEVTKKYELVQTSENDKKAGKNSGDTESLEGSLGNGRAYHLKLSFQVRNIDPNVGRVVSCLTDGPTGLPLEGAWFSAGRKTGPKMGSYGLRDLVVSINDRKTFNVISCWNIAQGKSSQQSDEIKLDFLGVDGQYFQCTAIPSSTIVDERFAYAPIRVGSRLVEHMNFTDVSYRLKSSDQKLAPYGQEGDSYSQEFTVFVGPKQRDVMADYGLSKTIVYGWFWFVSIPLLWILHFFHDYMVFNYGIAIMMLTVLVRLCLFPLSRKQVMSSMRMQQLQPEIAKLKEKYKDNPQEMMTAQQALFKKYGVNPLSGCLPIFIQMPIFIGLYRALSIDVNLYGAPLFAKSVRWCSNLAAPDMAVDWSSFWNSIGWPGFNMSGRGFLSMFCLGPYFNILPVVTIALFLIQQKLLVPPVVGDDEQARQQRSMRKMMNFMMIFMGFMFFKVPSGLCVYFIVSSLWGLLERKLLPKKQTELVPVASLNEPVSQTATVAGFESKKDKRRSFAATGRSYEVYELKRDKKGRRITSNQNTQKKSSLREWWNEVVERAKEQQKLAKAEYEDRGRFKKKDKKRRR